MNTIEASHANSGDLFQASHGNISRNIIIGTENTPMNNKYNDRTPAVNDIEFGHTGNIEFI
jgi:hypothetical protein